MVVITRLAITRERERGTMNAPVHAGQTLRMMIGKDVPIYWSVMSGQPDLAGGTLVFHVPFQGISSC